MARTTCCGDVSSSSSVPILSTIQLNEKEIKLFELLEDVASVNELSCCIRIAGGWVRDKLLGRESDDIDIALDNMTGIEFANLLNAYETNHGNVAHSIGVIKANPLQSKQLETATMHLNDFWVDFVNLRAEVYNEHSRIPEMKFGTPLEDALRRDFTVNSLFYNINKKCVEDFCETGLEDLQNGIIRTPLDPRVTFLDDPIRVLRAIRFSSRYEFELHESTRDSISLPEVKDALRYKISRERVGIELSGMIHGISAKPDRAHDLIFSCGLWNHVYLPPSNVDILDERGNRSSLDISCQQVWEKSNICVREMTKLIPSDLSDENLDDSTEFIKKERYLRLAILSAALAPMEQLYFLNSKNRKEYVVYFIVRESLKFKSKDAEDVSSRILNNINAFTSLSNREFTRLEAGLLLRKTGELWAIAIDVACVFELSQDTLEGCSARDSIIKRYVTLKKKIEAFGLVGCWTMKPLFNGKELMRLLNVPSGRGVGKMQEKLMEWQFAHPLASGEESLEYLRPLVALMDHA